MVRGMFHAHIAQVIVDRERFVFRRSSRRRLLCTPWPKRHRPSRRQTVQFDGQAWDKSAQFRVGDLDIFAVANDVRLGETEEIDDRRSAHVRRWEGIFVVTSGDVVRLRATWGGTNGAADAIEFAADDETITDADLRKIMVEIATEFGCPEDVFGTEYARFDEDLWRTHPPEARL